MRIAKLLLATMFAAAPLAAAWGQNEGLLAHPDNLPWPRWQARVSVSALDLYRPQATSLGLMSDYFFARAAAESGRASGFRATGGLVVGPQPTLWMVSPAMAGGPLTSADRRLAGEPADSLAVPYLGVGYSGLSGRNGWNFSADFGLVGQPARQTVRFGRAYIGAPGLEEQVRDLRLAPLLQVGVSYSF